MRTPCRQPRYCERFNFVSTISFALASDVGVLTRVEWFYPFGCACSVPDADLLDRSVSVCSRGKVAVQLECGRVDRRRREHSQFGLSSNSPDRSYPNRILRENFPPNTRHKDPRYSFGLKSNRFQPHDGADHASGHRKPVSTKSIIALVAIKAHWRTNRPGIRICPGARCWFLFGGPLSVIEITWFKYDELFPRVGNFKILQPPHRNTYARPARAGPRERRSH